MFYQTKAFTGTTDTIYTTDTINPKHTKPLEMSTYFTIEPQSYYQLYQKVKKDLGNIFSQEADEQISKESGHLNDQMSDQPSDQLTTQLSDQLVTQLSGQLTPQTSNKGLPMSLELYTECVCAMLFNTNAKTHKQFENEVNTEESMLTDLRQNIFILENKANYPFQTAISPIVFQEENIGAQYMYMLGLLLDESHFELFVANLFLKTQNPYLALTNALRYIKEELRILSLLGTTGGGSMGPANSMNTTNLTNPTNSTTKNDLIKHYLTTAKIIEKYDYKKLYPKTVKDRYTRLIELKELKNKSKWAMLINPFELASHNYMIYSPPAISPETHISCDSITCFKKPSFGANVTSTKELFTKRMNEFCFGLLENSPNPKIQLGQKFPFENVVFAGGCVTHLIESDMNALPNSDVDLFVYGDTYNQCLEAFNRIINWFDKPGNYYAIKGDSVVNIYLKDVSRIFQIINTNAKHPHDVLSNFDTSNVRWLAFYYDKDVNYPNAFRDEPVFMAKSRETANRNMYLAEANVLEQKTKPNSRQMQLNKTTKLHDLVSKSWHVFGTVDAIEAIRTRVASPLDLRKSSLERLMKTLYKGYHIEKTPALITAFSNICEIVSNPHDVKSYIFDLNAHFYIKSSSLSEYADEEQKNRYIEGMIWKFAKSDNITNSPEYVMKKTTIYVNFANDYNSISFTNFSVSQLRHGRHALPRDLDRGVMMRKLGGPLNIMSPYMKILQVIYGENKIEIEFELTKDFRDFINVVENHGISTYAKEGKIQSIITERNSIFVVIDNETIDNKQKNNVFILRNDRGEQLNIYEEIVADDVAKMLFRINVFKRDNTRSIKIEPIKFIKQVPENEPIILERFTKEEPRRLSFLQDLIETNKPEETNQEYKDLPI